MHKLPEALEKNLWQPGQSGNPAGRPKGARSQLTEDFLKDLHADFVEHGKQAIAEVREKDTSTYLRIVASLVPKELTINEGESVVERVLSSIPDSQFAGFVEGVRLLAIACQSGEGTTQAEATEQLTGVH